MDIGGTHLYARTYRFSFETTSAPSYLSNAPRTTESRVGVQTCRRIRELLSRPTALVVRRSDADSSRHS